MTNANIINAKASVQEAWRALETLEEADKLSKKPYVTVDIAAGVAAAISCLDAAKKEVACISHISKADIENLTINTRGFHP